MYHLLTIAKRWYRVEAPEIMAIVVRRENDNRKTPALGRAGVWTDQ